jgi:hypothetical protein
MNQWPQSLSPTGGDLPAQLDTCISRLTTLKRKLTEAQKDEHFAIKKCRSRIEHLVSLVGMESMDDPEYAKWTKVRLHRLIADYLLRNSYFDTAEKLSQAVSLQVCWRLYRKC